MSNSHVGSLQYLAAGTEVRASVDRTSLVSELAFGVVNRIAALALLLVLAPALLWIAFRIWREDGAPIFFGHYRVGRHGRLFRCLKFRTMVRDAKPRLAELLARDPKARAEWDRDQKLSCDPRITPIGDFLRRSSLDELPQLFNVLAGEMVLVGPRPITVPELAKYGVVRWHYLNVAPGMTGLWQVSGRIDFDYAQRVLLDRRYIETRSMAMDLSILLRTAGVVLRGSGAR
jgi:exopolysaccharide production protein ExoY